MMNKPKTGEYIAALANLPKTAPYHALSEEVVNIVNRCSTPDEVANLHKQLLQDLINRGRENSFVNQFPASIEAMYGVEVDRIETLCEKVDDEYFDLGNDLFLKDLAICSRRLLPAGAQLVEISGLPRTASLKNGLSNFIDFWRFVTFVLKGTAPLYEIHTNLSNLSDFNPEGWDRCYVRIGHLLKLNPSIKGMIGGSWFYDPEIEKISPKLAYLRQRPFEHNAKFFFANTEGIHSGALAKSDTRRRLYEEGHYIPRAYFMVWARRDLIEFSTTHEHLLDTPAVALKVAD